MLENIRKNIERLVALYEGEREKRIRLEAEVKSGQAREEDYRKQIAQLERQVDNLKLTQAFSSPAEGAPQAKEKIEKLIGEIDRCISLLEK